VTFSSFAITRCLEKSDRRTAVNDRALFTGCKNVQADRAVTKERVILFGVMSPVAFGDTDGKLKI